MRVFFVRPSDNGNYGVESALASAPSPPEELHVALFRGYRVPLEPLNFDPRQAGIGSLGRYDLVILAGLDPVALSAAEQLGLVAFVERGGGLLVLGGSHSFGNAEGTYALLEPVLPVRVLRGLDVEANAMPSTTAHPIARGLPAPLGYVGKVHPIEPKPGAHVAMKAGELPLVVAGEHGYGRVVVVASFPECEESEYGWFFTGDAFDDFIRSTAAWLQLANLADTPEQAWNYVQQARSINAADPAVMQAVDVIWPKVAASAQQSSPPRVQPPYTGGAQDDSEIPRTTLPKAPDAETPSPPADDTGRGDDDQAGDNPPQA